ncbi:MAG: hypothetical protein AB1578_03230 [Thermodesulfobacteriota bacterium]
MSGTAREGARRPGGAAWPERLAAAAAGAVGLGAAGHFLAQCARAVGDALRLGAPDAVRLVHALLGSL